MDVILHIGAHRTGTTAFQAWMLQNADALAGAGIAYWGPDRTRAGLFSGLVRRPDLVSPADEAGLERLRMRLGFEIDRLAGAGLRHLVISEENLLGAIPNCVEMLTLYPDARGRLERAGRALRPHLKGVALSIRRQDMWWASALSVTVGRGMAVPQRHEQARLAAHPRGWREVTEQAQAAFDLPVTVWSHEALGGDHVAQLGAMLPGAVLPAGLFEPGRRLNAAPGLGALRKPLAKAGHAVLGSNGRWMPFTQGERAQLTARYLEDLSWLRAAPPGVNFVERTAGDAGANPAAATVEEGQGHDGQKRGMA
ncbi:hypothetical protein [Thioclava pacifica]|uniref:Sulfotransferase domain-containing protein n=1 Tax=Thioclava pacifica DSM 10166 TaxID=1353537 RepID=A0A074JJZ2_9RHOB|nr:hypothetical protein [Thioclava pacifica]KEO56170.1 hypothetical protein TP2_01225 [Thioclava pacifica DSM 10166]